MDSPMLESQTCQLQRAVNDTQPALAALAGVLNANKVHLGISALAITPDTTYAALTAQSADYTGYAAQSIVWDVPTTSADNIVEVVSAPLVFRPTDAVVDNAVYNLWLSDSASAEWHFAGPIVGGPLPMASALDQILVTFRYRPATQTLVVTIA